MPQTHDKPEFLRLDAGTAWLLATGSALGWALVLWALSADFPYFSDSFAHLAVAREYDSFLACFDPARVPFRPLQHVVFWMLSGDALPATGRLVPLALHAAAGLVLFALARRLLHSRAAGLLALWLFLLFPGVKSLVWVAAVGWPGLVLGLTAAVLAFENHAETRSPRSGIALAGAVLLALLSHQSAILIVPVLLLFAVLRPEGPGVGLAARAATPSRADRRALARLRAHLRSPWVLGTLTCVVLFAVYVALLRENRHHGTNRLAAIPASLVKSGLAFAPEIVRSAAVEGLRTGGAALLGGAGLLLLFVLAALFVARRGGPVAWAAFGAAALYLLFPAITAGFVHRYAYGASAFVALLLAAWWAQRPGALRLVPLLVLGGFWLFDTATDLREHRESAQQVERALASVLEQTRAQPAVRTLVLIDAPYRHGAEEDVPTLQYGTAAALRRAGIEPELHCVRTQSYAFGTDFELVSPEQLEALRRRADLTLRYDATRHRYVQE